MPTYTPNGPSGGGGSQAPAAPPRPASGQLSPTAAPHPEIAVSNTRWAESYLVALAEGQPLPAKLAPRLRAIDGDHDGDLSAAEVGACPSEGMRLHLLLFDVDFDGALDRRETAKAVAHWKSKMQVSRP